MSEESFLLGDIGMSISNYITLIDLKNKIAQLPKRFNFIQCLHSSDRNIFIEQYLITLNSDERELKYYDVGVIKITTWLTIIDKIDLNYRYCIYRDAYYGENTGIKNISEVRVNYKAMLFEYGSDHIYTINLYINNRHISRINYFRSSDFVNKQQSFWDVIID